MIFCVKREYDYAIRICAYLAGHYQGGPISLSRISAKLFITRPFATKIVYQLKSAKIVDTAQGKHGGVFLNVRPRDLTLFEILKGMGLGVSISKCIDNPKFCPLPPPCKLHALFIEEENRLIALFKSKTINEFAFTEEDFDPAKTGA